jgi:hypothetical protein
MSIFSFLGSIFKPATKLIDSIHTRQAKVIQAEAQGSSWLQRNWRPITMITFLILVVCDAFGLLTFRLAEQAWTLLQIGLGGYVIGRSVEKSAPAVIKALSKDK